MSTTSPPCPPPSPTIEVSTDKTPSQQLETEDNETSDCQTLSEHEYHILPLLVRRKIRNMVKVTDIQVTKHEDKFVYKIKQSDLSEPYVLEQKRLNFANVEGRVLKESDYIHIPASIKVWINFHTLQLLREYKSTKTGEILFYEVNNVEYSTKFLDAKNPFKEY